MPKDRESTTERLRRFVMEFGKNIFKTDAGTLFCILCEKSITADRKSQIVGLHFISTTFKKS